MRSVTVKPLAKTRSSKGRIVVAIIREPKFRQRLAVDDLSQPCGLKENFGGVDHDPANLIGREAATPWDRGSSCAHEWGSFDTD